MKKEKGGGKNIASREIKQKKKRKEKKSN